MVMYHGNTRFGRLPREQWENLERLQQQHQQHQQLAHERRLEIQQRRLALQQRRQQYQQQSQEQTHARLEALHRQLEQLLHDGQQESQQVWEREQRYQQQIIERAEYELQQEDRYQQQILDSARMQYEQQQQAQGMHLHDFLSDGLQHLRAYGSSAAPASANYFATAVYSSSTARLVPRTNQATTQGTNFGGSSPLPSTAGIFGSTSSAPASSASPYHYSAAAVSTLATGFGGIPAVASSPNNPSFHAPARAFLNQFFTGFNPTP